MSAAWIIRACLIAMLVAPYMATAAQKSAFEEGLPLRIEDDLDKAVEARHAGRNREAIALLQPILSVDPSNSDALVQMGYALLNLGHLDRAAASFQSALKIAPDYIDASDGLALVERRRQDDAAANRSLRIDIDASYTSLEDNRPSWKEKSVQLAYDFDESTTIAGRVEASSRFGISDVYAEFRLDHALGERVNAYLTAGSTPSADYRPEVQIGVGGAVRIRDGGNATVLTIDARHASYPDTTVSTISPGLEQYFASGRVWLTGRMVNIFEEGVGHRTGWFARSDLQASESLRLFAGVSSAPDVAQGVVLDASSYFAGLAYTFSNSLVLRASGTHDSLPGNADRTNLTVGVGFAF